MTCGQKYAKNITRHANNSYILFINLVFQGSINFMQPRINYLQQLNLLNSNISYFANMIILVSKTSVLNYIPLVITEIIYLSSALRLYIFKFLYQYLHESYHALFWIQLRCRPCQPWSWKWLFRHFPSIQSSWFDAWCTRPWWTDNFLARTSFWNFMSALLINDNIKDQENRTQVRSITLKSI